ncbi:MAG TPA: SprT-like domain-containing protein [Bacillota bacterium]|jgi:predicted SprT family Zn-dependent metalloprotease
MDLATVRRAFDSLNERYFDGRLKARLELSSRMTATAGKCYYRRGVIRLSQLYLQQFPERLAQLLLHEMIHLVAPGHGAAFKAQAKRCGVPPEGLRDFTYCRPFAPKRRSQWRYVYECPSCGRRFVKRRAGQWSCGRCSPRYDPRFKLQLKERHRV